MIARVLHVDVDPDRLDAIIAVYRESVRPIHARAAGLRRHYVLVDREKGRMEFIGVWDSGEAVAAVAAELEPARQRLWEQFGQAPMIELFEVGDGLSLAP